jgi:hypothetical protein
MYKIENPTPDVVVSYLLNFVTWSFYDYSNIQNPSELQRIVRVLEDIRNQLVLF